MEFEAFENLYQHICQNHVERLYDLYNSEINTYNTKSNSKKIIIKFDPREINNASACSDASDIIIIYKGLLKNLHKATQLFIEREYQLLTDDEKATISFFVFSISTHFIICHEFAHLYCGHSDLLNKINNKNVFLRLDFDSDIGITPLDHQALEMNADAVAACRTTDYVLFEPYHHRSIIESIHNKNMAVDLLLKAMNITFFVLRSFMPPISDIYFETRSHHPALLRQIMNNQTLIKYLQTEYGKSISEKNIDEHFASDEKTLCELFYVPLNAEHYKNNLSQVILEHEQKLRTHWNSLYNKLAPFSRSELPPIF